MKCPSFERLIDYLDGKLTGSNAERVALHLGTGCSRCATDSNWYNALKRTASEDDSSAPPPWVLRRAFRVPENVREGPGLIARIGERVASLIFDSFARPAPAGVRSTEPAARQLLYKAGEFSIDIQVVSSERSRVSLLGQVLRERELAFESVDQLELELVQNGVSVRSTSATDLGEFAFSGIEPGVFDLRIRIPERSITVPDLPIKLR